MPSRAEPQKQDHRDTEDTEVSASSVSPWLRLSCRMRGLIRFEGRFSPDIFHRARGGRWRELRVYAWIFIIVTVIGFSMASLDEPVTWVILAAFGLLGWMTLISPRMAVKRAFATDPTLADPVSGDADEQGVRMESTHGRVDLSWARMHKVVVTPNLVTFY